MGSGKTTVIAPLLCLMLADGANLVMQAVPTALLEFSRGITFERFSNPIIRKPVFTFTFDRFTDVSPKIYNNFITAREKKAVVVTTPTAIKAFMLKYVELLHSMDSSLLSKKYRSVRLASLPKETLLKQASVCKQVLTLWGTSYLLMDEVDLILHPLKSELNYPLGQKEPLDMTTNRLGKGLRWELPFVILDVLFYARDSNFPMISTPLMSSQEVDTVIQKVRAVMKSGTDQKTIQWVPHFILLDRPFYHKNLLPLLAQITAIWLSLQRKVQGLSAEQTFKYLLTPIVAGQNIREKVQNMGINPDLLDDEYMKLMNLAHDLLHSVLPFVLGKIDRVSFGLLSPGM